MARASKSGTKAPKKATKASDKTEKSTKDTTLNQDKIDLPSSGDSSEESDFGGFDDDDGVVELQKPEESTESHTVHTSVHTVTKSAPSKSKKVASTASRGVVYVGRIPHGFFESEMRRYFGQFGEITRLRLSRNKKTGESKHYGFIEFADAEVAKVAAETMNNYLLFNHMLKVEVIPREKVHDALFVGSNTKFKPVPWRKISHALNDAPKTLEQWKKIEEKVNEGLAKKKKKFEEEGIDYDIEAAMY